MPTLLRTLLLCFIGTSLVSCDSKSSRPAAGDLDFSVVSPHRAEGAALIELRGPGMGPVTPLDTRLFVHDIGNRVRVLVLRTDPGTLSFRVTVNDVNNPPSAMLLEVAAGDNTLREDLAGYRVEHVIVAMP